MVVEKIIWSKEFSIGNEKIDSEHKTLFEIYNNLLDIKNREEFARILTKMTDYGLMHFKKEEAYMEELLYPKLLVHKNFHRDYIYRVAMYNVDLLSTNPPDPKEILKFLRKWWTYHILHNDFEYEKFREQSKSNVCYKSY